MGRKAKKSKEGWSRWYALPDSEKGKRIITIKRYLRKDGKTTWERLPRAEYKGLDDQGIKALVVRLNGEIDNELNRARAAYEIKHQFITRVLLDEWESHIRTSQNNDALANRIILTNQKYFLSFFINKMSLSDPVDWYEKQEIWGRALLNKKPVGMSENVWARIRLLEPGKRWSKKTICDVVMFANRFISFIHKKKPKLFPLLKFEPVSKSVLRKHQADWRLKNPNKGIGLYVKPDHWKTILKECDPKILQFIKLAYKLGLRDAETLGVDRGDIRKGYFHLKRQLVAIPKPDAPEYGPPKNRLERKIYYWLADKKEIYEIVTGIDRLCHPDTLSRRVSAEMQRLGFPYTLHDFRRTWITNALKAGIAVIDVRDAAGHKDIQTTNLYAIRDEDFEDDVYEPSEDE